MSYNDVWGSQIKNKVYGLNLGIKKDVTSKSMNEKITLQYYENVCVLSKYTYSKNIIELKDIPGYLDYKKINPYADSSIFIETLNHELFFDSKLDLDNSKEKCLSSALELLIIKVDKRDDKLKKLYLQRKDINNFYFRYLKNREFFLKKRDILFLQYQKTNNR